MDKRLKNIYRIMKVRRQLSELAEQNYITRQRRLDNLRKQREDVLGALDSDNIFTRGLIFPHAYVQLKEIDRQTVQANTETRSAREEWIERTRAQKVTEKAHERQKNALAVLDLDRELDAISDYIDNTRRKPPVS